MDEGLIRPLPPSKEKSAGSIRTAENWLKEAENNMKSESPNSSVLASYMAIFHAARAVLFRDGFREKSHYCIARYLEDRYAKTGKLEATWIELLDHYRELRHEKQYDTEFMTTEEEVVDSFEAAKSFVRRIKSLLGGVQ